MLKLRVFGSFVPGGTASTFALTDKVEEGLKDLKETNKLEHELTHSPATKTIYYNGDPVGCYYFT